jgi:hypothetical protein
MISTLAWCPDQALRLFEQYRIAEVQARRAVAQTTVRKSKEHAAVMTREEINVVIDQLGDIRTVIADADPDDKARVYQQLGLKLTYQPGKRTTRADVILDPWGYRLCPRPELISTPTLVLRGELLLPGAEGAQS